ncbi:MAG: hypothetical protein ACIAXF_09605 [Phycisphaerales bacterium JB063]
MLKQTALIVALGVTPVFGTAIVMADGPAPGLEEDLAIASGKVLSIDKDNWQFTIEVAPLEQVDVDWNDETAFTLDGETSTADEVLVAQRLVTVEHANGLAVNVRGVTDEEAPETPE